MEKPKRPKRKRIWRKKRVATSRTLNKPIETLDPHGITQLPSGTFVANCDIMGL